MKCSPLGLACLLIVCLTATSCRETRQAPAHSSAVEAMHALVGRVRFERLGADCRIFEFLLVATAPQEIFTETYGCREEAADTTYYLYLDEQGIPVVAGRTFSIHPETVGRAFIVSRNRLRSLSNRERPALLARYGPSAPCPLGSPYRPYEGWMERWDGEDFGVLLIASYTELIGSIVLEVHAGEPSCDRMAGPPYGH